jgi:hypothetical protein
VRPAVKATVSVPLVVTEDLPVGAVVLGGITFSVMGLATIDVDVDIEKALADLPVDPVGDTAATSATSTVGATTNAPTRDHQALRLRFRAVGQLESRRFHRYSTIANNPLRPSKTPAIQHAT